MAGYEDVVLTLLARATSICRLFVVAKPRVWYFETRGCPMKTFVLRVTYLYIPKAKHDLESSSLQMSNWLATSHNCAL